MRYALRIRLLNLEPLVLGNEPQAGNVVRAAPYIPGGALVGFFANDYLRRNNGATDDEFCRWFLSPATRFENLYRAWYRSESKCYAGAPLPRSTFTCKDYPGKHEESEGEEHPMLDCLLLEVPPKTCPDPSCQAEIKTAEGFYYYRSDRGAFYRVDPAIDVNMHNAIDDERQRPPDPGGLFAFECLEEEQHFEGQIAFDSAESKEGFREFFSDVLNGEREVYLGRAKRRHYGRARIMCVDDIGRSLAELLYKSSFEHRWANFAERSGYGDGAFALTLYSDVILCDRALLYGTSVTAKLLALETGLEAGKLGLIRGFSSYRRVGGFSGVQGLPKEFDIAVSKGSAFLFRYSGDCDRLKATLKQIEEWGIGFRTNEGFGTLIVNDGYHLQQREGEG